MCLKQNDHGRNDVVISQLFNLTTDDKSDTDEEYISFQMLCSSYDVENEFILVASIRTDRDEVNDIIPRKIPHLNRNSMYVLKFMKIPLISFKHKPNSPRNFIVNQEEDERPLTLILTSLNRPPSNNSNHNESTEISNLNSSENRQLFLANLLNEFDQRGIKLRHKYPKIYRDLCMYVEDNRPFTPVCLFPRDLNKNNLFMCLIMPNSEPINYTWLYENKDNSKINQNGHKSGNLNKSDDRIDLSQYFYIV